jgi:hypothetical protein
MIASAGAVAANGHRLELGRRSLLHAELCGHVVPISIVLSTDDAPVLSARSGAVLAELLPLVSEFFNAHVSANRADAADAARAETLSGETITARLELRESSTKLFVSSIRDGGRSFGREGVTAYEISVVVADRAASVLRTAAVLAPRVSP